ncbi:hypothetical protein KCU81_g8819, partial [Aureobasidium melanogenum]
MARQLLLAALFLTTALAQTLNVTSDQPFTPRSNAYGWSPAVLLQSSSGICPLYAYINCQSISGPNYCCGAGTYCAYGGPENHIGCCADNAVCSGEPDVRRGNANGVCGACGDCHDDNYGEADGVCDGCTEDDL